MANFCRRIRGLFIDLTLPQAYACGYMLLPHSRLICWHIRGSLVGLALPQAYACGYMLLPHARLICWFDFTPQADARGYIHRFGGLKCVP